MYISTLNDLKYYVRELTLDNDERLMVYVGESCEKEVQEMINFFNSRKIPFFGGIYSRLLVSDKSVSKGYIVNKVKPAYYATVFSNSMEIEDNLEENEDYLAIIVADGLSSSFKELTDKIYNKFGNKVQYLGGGAGFYNFNHKPCVFDNNGITMDAIYMCVIKTEAKIEIEHGWSILKGPFCVTKSNKNILSELDKGNAFERYSEILERETGMTIYKKDFFTYAKEYPFGIMNGVNTELVVRGPISINDNLDIVCVADIPEGSSLFVLTGNIKSLLESSLTIADKCSKIAPKEYKPLLFDCISRAMFLEDNFIIELANIQNSMNCTVEGALSIGEISSKRDGSLVIHSKSTVLGLIKRV